MQENEAKDTFFSKNRSLNCRGKLVHLDTPAIMGILNITPDSFHDGGRYMDANEATDRAGKMLDAGAAIIDVGAASSRPGAEFLHADQELERLHPVMAEIRKWFPEAVLSIDTFHAKVAGEMIEQYHADIINDISAGEMDEEMIPLIARLNVPYLIMHMKGNPQNMQADPEYTDVCDEIIQYFSEKIHLLHKKGISDILIDPGFGFGKTQDHNYELLGRFSAFQLFELPVVAGISRKSMIYKLLESDSEHALNGTTAAHMLLLERGANILRVHDVKEAREVITIFLETMRKIR